MSKGQNVAPKARKGRFRTTGHAAVTQDKLDRSQRRARTLAGLERLAFNPGPLAAVVQTDGTCPDQLIKVLSQCPILTSRLIGVANAAGSSALHRMDSIERCIRHLGAKQTRTVALTLALQLITQDLDIDQQLVNAIWASSTTKAVAARMVAEVVSPNEAEQAYSYGLVQDIALPILLALDPAFFTNTLSMPDARKSWVEMEQEHFGIDHAELGALLLQSWGTPQSITKQVRKHHVSLADDDMAWVAEMPSRLAGLLPHLDEPSTKAQAQMLAAAHTRFLTERYKTLESFMQETHSRVKKLGKAAGGPVKLGADFASKITQAVAADTFALVAQVTRLDNQLAEQVDKLANVQSDALSDPLTGLLNRRGFESFGSQMLSQAAKSRLPATCLVIDLDDFKPINDQYGHAAGDTLLKAASELLKSIVSSADLVARLGGDEYAVLVVGATQGDALAMAQRVHATCNGRGIVVGPAQKATLKMSIGGAHFPHLHSDLAVDDLLDSADQAMYRCKQKGKSGLEFQADQRPAA